MMTLKNTFNLYSMYLCLFLLMISISSSAYTISGIVKKGNGTLHFFKTGTQISSASVLNTGDTVTVFASPADNEGLESLIIGTTTYQSAPINVVIGTANLAVEASFVIKTVYFHESFGKLTTASIAEFYQDADSVYNGYDNANEAIFSSTNAATKVKNYTFGKSNFTSDATEIYMQNSNFTIKMYCDKIINAYNLQIKFRLIPVNSNDLRFGFSKLDITTNDATSRIPIGNEPVIPVFSATSTAPFVAPTYAHLAPFTVLNIPNSGTYPININSLKFKINTVAGFLNRCRIDDISIVGDNSSTKVTSQNYSNDITISTNKINLTLDGNIKIGSIVKLYNLLGVQLVTKTVTDSKTQLSTKDLIPGVYVISVVTNFDKTINLKAII